MVFPGLRIQGRTTVARVLQGHKSQPCAGLLSESSAPASEHAQSRAAAPLSHAWLLLPCCVPVPLVPTHVTRHSKHIVTVSGRGVKWVVAPTAK